MHLVHGIWKPSQVLKNNYTLGLLYIFSLNSNQIILLVTSPISTIFFRKNILENSVKHVIIFFFKFSSKHSSYFQLCHYIAFKTYFSRQYFLECDHLRKVVLEVFLWNNQRFFLESNNRNRKSVCDKMYFRGQNMMDYLWITGPGWYTEERFLSICAKIIKVRGSL